jgi:23S rRNA (pseudouridine1915-N3)-methyltransferase
VKTAGLPDTVEYYSRLISGWSEFKLIELKPKSVPDKSSTTRKKIQVEESDLLFSKIGKTPYFLLDECGKPQTTLKWADFFHKQETLYPGGFAICIGSSLGFSDSLRAQAKGLLSLGPQTMAHELARVVLFEQIFRALSVLKKHPYHNEGT